MHHHRLLFLLAALSLFALSACPTGVTGPTERRHASGYGAADAHALDAKLATEDCRICHGDQLDGGTSGVSCDQCHQSGWRTNCTYCHGGEDSDTGAPPRDIRGVTVAADTTYWPHTKHTIENDGPAYACLQCHRDVQNVMDEGHMFDDTPGVAEVDFSLGISPDAQWNGDGCTNAYCHGDGVQNGDQALAVDSLPCGSCHAVQSSSFGDLLNLRGRHSQHVFSNSFDCHSCHPDTGNGTDIIDASLHANGEVNIRLAQDVVWDNGRCTGRCHGRQHNNYAW